MTYDILKVCLVENVANDIVVVVCWFTIKKKYKRKQKFRKMLRTAFRLGTLADLGTLHSKLPFSVSHPPQISGTA